MPTAPFSAAALSGAVLPDLTLPALRSAYAGGRLTPRALVETIAATLDSGGPDTAWIATFPRAALLAQVQALEARADARRLPLYGVPFAAKDNIDVAGLPTTAACRDFARMPAADAFAVQRLRAAGALCIGKTNLDQFATGLVGTRSPYGAVPNSLQPEFISGGSSSGSATVVARGLVSFSLGTDTAGSGRVPAGLNNLVGLKPTRGLISTRGLVPACRTLDCISVFALTCDDAAAVLDVLAAFDADDPYARPAAAPQVARIERVGIPAAPEFYGDTLQSQAYAHALAQARALGLELVPTDFAPLHQAAALLYEGPWVAERHAAIREFFDAHPAAIDPSVRTVIAGAAKFSATDAFAAQYKLAELKRAAERIFADLDALLVPTAPTVYRIAEVQADPIRLNSRLGRYTNFVNLLDLSALAVPSSLRTDGLPFGVTFIAPAFCEDALLALGGRWQRALDLPLGATQNKLPATPATRPASPHTVRVAVVGAHLSGMPLNAQLTERRALRVAETATAPCYRLYALPDTTPPKPGLRRVAEGGAAIALEVWEMPLAHFGSFVALVGPPLGIGSVELADGSWVKGFICEPHALDGARDITSFGGWRNYLRAASSQ
jgi:allophanate hydrolase